MSWENALTNLLRNIIGDTDPSNYINDDDKLQSAIVAGGLYASIDYPFEISYSFDLIDDQITPDPVESGDQLAMALFVLRAACIMNTGSLHGSIRTGIKVQDGDSLVDTTGSFAGYNLLMKIGPCSAYNRLLQSSMETKSSSLGGAVFGPFSTGDGNYCYDYRNHCNFWNILL